MKRLSYGSKINQMVCWNSHEIVKVPRENPAKFIKVKSVTTTPQSQKPWNASADLAQFFSEVMSVNVFTSGDTGTHQPKIPVEQQRKRGVENNLLRWKLIGVIST